ncbi:hypothetical protein AVEN_21500-1, partial [Araneus ventricosus]
YFDFFWDKSFCDFESKSLIHSSVVAEEWTITSSIFPIHYPKPESIRDHLNESHHNVNRRTEGGVLMNITTCAQPLSQEVHPVIGVLAAQPHTTTFTREARTRLLMRWLLFHVLVVPTGGRVSVMRSCT